MNLDTQPDSSQATTYVQGLLRLLQFSSFLSSESKTKLQLAWWNDLIREYFTPKAYMKLTLWKDNQRKEAKPFEIGVPILPRFFLVTTQSGVKSMSLSLDGARERYITTGHCIVECVSAVWTYKYNNGYTVTLRGALSAHVIITATSAPGAASQTSGQPNPPYSFKFDEFTFDANYHDKFIALDAIVGTRIRGPRKSTWVRNTSSPDVNSTSTDTSTSAAENDQRRIEPRVFIKQCSVPGEHHVNAFGIPQATMRFLELAENMDLMEELIIHSTDMHLDPLEALRSLASRIRQGPVSLPGTPSHTATTGDPATATATAAAGSVGAVVNGYPGGLLHMPPSPSASSQATYAIPQMPLVGQSQGLLSLLSFSSILSDEDKAKTQLAWWNDLIREYFTLEASMKLVFRRHSPHKGVKTFNIRVPIIPHFFLSTALSGVKTMSLSLDDAKERYITTGRCFVKCASAAWIYKYDDYIVTLRGSLSAHIMITSASAPGSTTPNSSQPNPPYNFKFDELTFNANVHDKLIAPNAIAGTHYYPAGEKSPWIRRASSHSANGTSTASSSSYATEDERWEEPRVTIKRCSLPGEPVNEFGIPPATLLCLEEYQKQEDASYIISNTKYEE
ncbi:hypothetical protein Agabi119p4_4815 [Agaricus bisporus var. burnettii]|uniref:Uncharacterized protein n=1 Tax=Agaricus bisporus var. burnettii TaxID=192524 RepID=A0A8H7F3Z6_AGABI|nr:hypothetical protein Agabi119p4_4815 [Agaricus bisporus var. burnettii]